MRKMGRDLGNPRAVPCSGRLDKISAEEKRCSTQSRAARHLRREAAVQRFGSNGFSLASVLWLSLEAFEKVLHINYPPVQIDVLMEVTTRCERFGAEISRSFKFPPALVRQAPPEREKPLFGSWCEAAAFALRWVRQL